MRTSTLGSIALLLAVGMSYTQITVANTRAAPNNAKNSVFSSKQTIAYRRSYKRGGYYVCYHRVRIYRKGYQKGRRYRRAYVANRCFISRYSCGHYKYRYRGQYANTYAWSYSRKMAYRGLRACKLGLR